MNKYIRQFQQMIETPPQVISMDDLNRKGKPKKRKQRNEKQQSRAEAVVSALSVVNAMTLTGEYVTGDVSEQEKADVIEFVEWFLHQYDDDRVMGAIKENWPWGPRVFRLYNGMKQEQTMIDAENAWNILSRSEQKQAEALADIIWSHRTYRKISITYNDDSVWKNEIPKTVPKNQLNDCKDTIRLMIGDFMYNGGAMIYRRGAKEKGKYIVCGFVAGMRNGKHEILSYPIDDLREACETMPDGSRQVWDDDIYDVIELPKEEPLFRVVK